MTHKKNPGNFEANLIVVKKAKISGF